MKNEFNRNNSYYCSLIKYRRFVFRLKKGIKKSKKEELKNFIFLFYIPY